MAITIKNLAAIIDSKYILDHDNNGKIILKGIKDIHAEWMAFTCRDRLCSWFDFKIALQFLSDMQNSFE